MTYESIGHEALRLVGINKVGESFGNDEIRMVLDEQCNEEVRRNVIHALLYLQLAHDLRECYYSTGSEFAESESEDYKQKALVHIQRAKDVLGRL